MIKSSLAIICIVLSIILLLPMLCRKLHIPAIVGFILVGMGIGPLGFNLIAESETIRVLGQMGMLYIMFQSGSEMDLGEMKTQRWRAVLFGIYTFLFPFGLGLITSHYLLDFDWTTSVLLGAMYGSHTLMTYPIVSRYGLQKSRSVNIVVGGTVLALTASLLILAEVSHPVNFFHVWNMVGIVFYVFVVMWAFPEGGRWFLKRYQDPVAEYMLIMVLLVVAAEGAALIGLEPILGAFIAGIALNPLLPNHSHLMNRITFVGNTIFVPIFLLSVGMLIDVSVFFSSWTVFMIAGVMIATKLLSKWLAAALAQWQFRLNSMERQLIFGLTHATAAGTLAIVQIGYNTGIFTAEVLNAAVLMILVLCTISSFVTEHATKQLALQEEAKLAVDKDVDEWLVFGDSSIATAASLPQPQIVPKVDWNEIKQQIARVSKSVTVYRQQQPLNTIERLIVAVPRYAEKERDFLTCFGVVRRLSGEIGAKVIFYCTEETRVVLQKMCARQGKVLHANYRELNDWADVASLTDSMHSNDMLVLLSSRQSTASYDPSFERIPYLLEESFQRYNWMVIYPEQQMGELDVDSFLTESPQASSTWKLVTGVLDAIRRVAQKLCHR